MLPLLSSLIGALVTLSLAPFDLWPLGILSCLLLCLILDRCEPRQALWCGWFYGLGFFGTGVSWVYVSIHVYGQASMPLAIFLTAAFCAGLAFFHALFAWCYVRWLRDLPGGLLFGFPALWVLLEWLRGWILTGFPWLYLGYAHLDTPLAGWGPVVGVFGLSLACALSATCLLLGWRHLHQAIFFGCLSILLIMWGGGALLRSTDWVRPSGQAALNVALYQPNIPLEHKWDSNYLPQILRQYREAMSSLYGRDLVIWPESAVPRYYQDIQEWISPVALRAGRDRTALITGIPYRESGSETIYNSIVAVGNGEGVYHKQRLVPFGEYVPLEGLLRGLIAFFDLPMSSFSPGPHNQGLLRAGKMNVAPLICYEIAYPELVARSARESDMLVTISNDIWFGKSIGPLQHLQIARMRALENGRYVLRATNNGVSAIIDHLGRIVARSRQFVRTTVEGRVQVLLGRTPFSRHGVAPVIVACALVLVVLVVLGRKSLSQAGGSS
ncbi:MAG: apolipoprotein N-acyltransferase [Parahaliea sp.]